MPRGRTRSRSRDRARRKSGSRRTRSRDHSKRHRRDDDRRGDGERRTKHARSSRRGERRRTSSSRRSRSPARNHNDDRRKRNDKRSSAKATELSDSQRIAAQLAAGAGVGAAINAAPIQPIQQHLHHHHHPNSVLHAANAPSPFPAAAAARHFAIAGQPLTQGMFQPAQLLNKSAAALSALAALGGGASGATTAAVAAPAPPPPVVPAAAPAVVGANGVGPQEKWQKEQQRQKEEYDRQQEYLQHERMREQEAAAREMQRQAQETATATGADVVPQGREAAKVDEEEEEEIDPLDQFMQKQENLAKEELQDALQREHIDKLTFLSGGTVEDDDEATAFTSADASKHCYICKENGHTKGDCPQKRCPYCTERGHIQIACPAWLEHNAKVQAEEKARKRKRQRELLKAKKKQQAIHQLRVDSGVYGYKELYNLLGLPDDKLAPMGAIKKAFQVQSLKWHPDKWSGKSEQEQADAAAHYSKVREAYDVLNEGLERGFAGGGALVSGGTIAGSS